MPLKFFLHSNELLPHSIQISQKCFEASLKGCAYNAGWVKIRLRSPQSWRVLPGPQWTQRADIIGESQFCIPVTEKFSFEPRAKTTFWLFWGPFWASRAWFSLSQRLRHNFEGSQKNISEIYGWSGGVICRYFSTRNSCENLNLWKETPLLYNLLFSFFLDVHLPKIGQKSDISGALKPIHHITLKAFAMALGDRTKCKTCFGCPHTWYLSFFYTHTFWVLEILHSESA